jgi:selenide,water dikinase
VYAVREGPVLAHNLAAAARGSRPKRYAPQRTFLSLLNSGDGRAILRWHEMRAHARWAWLLKDRIDRRFVARWRSA